VTAPLLVWPVYGDHDIDAGLAPSLQLAGVEQVAGRAGPDQQRHPPVPGALRGDRDDHRAQRRQPDPTGHYHDVVPGRRWQVPRGAERAPHPDDPARLRGVQRGGHRTDRAKRVHQALSLVVDAAHRDRYLADAVRGEQLPSRRPA
jgi:hypothetical protein